MARVNHEADVPESYLEVVANSPRNQSGRAILTFNERQMRIKKKAYNYPHDNLSPSRYDYVEVFLAQWADDNLQVDLEVGPLEKLFKEDFNFNVTRYSIPSEESEHELSRAIMDFKKGKGDDHLLIFYYAGHAGGTPSNCIFAATNRSDSPTLNFNSVSGSLLGHGSDLFMILDCCFSTIAASQPGKYNNWFLGASSKESEATGVSRDSFTRALIRALERGSQRYWADNIRFSVQSVHSGLSLWEPDLQMSPNLIRLTDREYEPIELTPLLTKRQKRFLLPSHTVACESSSAISSEPRAPPPRMPTPGTGVNGTKGTTTTTGATGTNGTNGTNVANGASKTSRTPEKGKARVVDKEEVFGRLKAYDTVFLVDDSGSMAGSRWKVAAAALGSVAEIAVRHDGDGVDVRFFNSWVDPRRRKSLSEAEDVMALFGSVKPGGPTLTADLLEEELNEYMVKLEGDRDAKGLNLIVITDGEPSQADEQDVGAVICKYARRLNELRAHEFKVGIQFVQIGSDPEATEFLDWLDNGLKEHYKLDRDMVDTVPWEAGDQTFLYEKILLGGILKKYDRMQRGQTTQG